MSRDAGASRTSTTKFRFLGGDPMSATAPVRLYMSMSLDGYIAGPHDEPGQELGHGGGRLFNWLDDRHGPGVNGQVYAEAMATGAVISGRRTFELAGRWNGDHHDGVPINVLTHHVTDGDEPPGSARFFTVVDACVDEAEAAAGDRAVMVHGAGAALALPGPRAARRDRDPPGAGAARWRAATLRRQRSGRARAGTSTGRTRRAPPAVPGDAVGQWVTPPRKRRPPDREAPRNTEGQAPTGAWPTDLCAIRDSNPEPAD